MMPVISDSEILSAWNMAYNISLNMLHNPLDAEDAVQDVFEKIFKNLKNFEGRSAFTTWVYRIAYNHLLDLKKRRFRDEISFELFEKDISSFVPYDGSPELTEMQEESLTDQIKNGCTMAMLQCLDAENRFIYVIGSIFCVSSADAAYICGLTQDVYRKRLSRAREKIRNFMSRNCGLLNSEAFCSCRKRIFVASEKGRLDKSEVQPERGLKPISRFTEEMNDMDAAAAVFRSNRFYEKSSLYFSRMKERYEILREKCE